MIMKKVLLTLVLLLGALALPATAHAQGITGDVNADGEVNVADVNAAIAVVLTSGGSSLADVNGDGEINIADVNFLIDIILSGSTQPVPDYVDLGLPSGTLWATRNVGASKPEDYGDYFAWGETVPKETYSWATYKWCEGDKWSITKYDPMSYWKYDEIELAPEDDAATVNWGPSWRMPTSGQLQELCDNCSWQWTQRNGVNGKLVTGPNGNTLFLPAAGYRDKSSLTNIDKRGRYWSRTVDYNDESLAFLLSFDSGRGAYCYTITPGRSGGFPVRPVRVQTADEKSLHIGQRSLDLGEVHPGQTRTNELTIVNSTNEDVTLTVAVDEPFLLKQEEGAASSMTIEVPSNSIAPLTVMFTAGSTGDFNGNVTFQSPALDAGQSVIPVHARALAEGFEEHPYVNLGLPSGTLWATCNIGAENPEDYGDYFAWGETVPKDYYGWSTYKWCRGGVNSSGFIKYCTDSLGYNGFTDGKMELDLADDAATVNWGPQWRMPSEVQLQELYDNCSVAWTQRNGVDGVQLTGPNGYKLFLPAAGQRIGVGRQYSGLSGILWSRTLHGEGTNNAVNLSFYSDDLYLYIDKRCYGFTIRPVRAQQ